MIDWDLSNTFDFCLPNANQFLLGYDLLYRSIETFAINFVRNYSQKRIIFLLSFVVDLLHGSAYLPCDCSVAAAVKAFVIYLVP